MQDWARRANLILGADPRIWTARHLAHAGQHHRPLPVRAGAIDEQATELLAAAALDQVEAKRATWSRWNLVAAATRALTAAGLHFSTPRDLLVARDRVAASTIDRSVLLNPTAVDPTVDQVDPTTGREVTDKPEVFTSLEVLAAEDRLLETSDDTTAPTVTPAVVEAVVDADLAGRDYGLEPDQAAAVQAICTSRTSPRCTRRSRRNRQDHHNGRPSPGMGSRARPRNGRRPRDLRDRRPRPRHRNPHRRREHRPMARPTTTPTPTSPANPGATGATDPNRRQRTSNLRHRPSNRPSPLPLRPLEPPARTTARRRRSRHGRPLHPRQAHHASPPRRGEDPPRRRPRPTAFDRPRRHLRHAHPPPHRHHPTSPASAASATPTAPSECGKPKPPCSSGKATQLPSPPTTRMTGSVMATPTK